MRTEQYAVFTALLCLSFVGYFFEPNGFLFVVQNVCRVMTIFSIASFFSLKEEEKARKEYQEKEEERRLQEQIQESINPLL